MVSIQRYQRKNKDIAIFLFEAPNVAAKVKAIFGRILLSKPIFGHSLNKKCECCESPFFLAKIEEGCCRQNN